MASLPFDTSDPEAYRKRLAMAMVQGAGDTSPVQHWSQGANRIVQALMGANMMNSIGMEQGKKDAEYRAALSNLPGLGGTPQAATPASPMAAALTQTAGDPAAAIASIESGGRYDAMGPVTKSGDRAYGKYQIMGNNIPQWTKAVLGQEVTPDQFVANPAIQDAVFKQKFGEYSQKYGPEGASRAWFAGEGGMNNLNAKDQLGTTVAQYGQKFAQALGPQAAASSAAVPQQAAPGVPAEQIRAMLGSKDPRMQALGMKMYEQNFAPQKPMEVNGKLVNPRTGAVIADYSNPQPVTVGETVIDGRTGRPIYQGEQKPQPVTVGETVIDARTGKPIYQGQQKPNIEYKELPDGRIVALDKNKVGQGVDVTPAGGGPTNPYAMAGKPTEGQSASANYANRMVESHNVMDKLESAGTSKLQAGLSAVPVVNNLLVSTDRQKLEQAQRDFVNAILRKESGAAIGKDEFNSASKQYFPQPGDSPETIAQKKINRETAVQGIMGGAGPTYKPPAAFKPGGSKPNTTASGIAWSIE